MRERTPEGEEAEAALLGGVLVKVLIQNVVVEVVVLFYVTYVICVLSNPTLLHSHYLDGIGLVLTFVGWCGSLRTSGRGGFSSP